MATSQMSGVIQHLRRTVLLRDGAGLTDGQLLTDYISRRDEAALAALVHRHGPMVLGVCRRVLRNYHDAEDAFQATFLVLVRKAVSIASRELVANWLYGVAHQTALKARATAAKRKGRERQVTEMPEPAVAEQEQWRDLQPLLDEELSRLPDKYRAVIVLCDLEGKTRKEAARQLGVPEGTVGGWLARARTTLAKRLTQRGVGLSGGALAVMLSQDVASAGVLPSVVSATIKAASLYAAGQAAATGAISAKVAALTEGVLRTMLVTKLKAVMILFLFAGLTGATGLIYQTQAAEQPKGQQGKETLKTPDTEKNKTPKAPNTEQARKVITTAGEHELCDGIWRVEALQVEGGGDAAKDKNLKGVLRVKIVNVLAQKFIAFNRTFSENSPWFVSASSPNTILFYDGDKEMHLVTLSERGDIESKTTQLPKEWVDLLNKQRPQPVQVPMIQERGPDGKIRLRPAGPAGPIPPYSGAKDGEVVPPPNK